MGKSSGGGGGTVVQKNEPPAYLLPFLKDAATAAQTLYQKGPQPLFPGQDFAPINNEQRESMDAILATARGGGPWNADALQALDDMVNSTPGQNPYLDQMLDVYGRKANALVASNFNKSGRYGSGSHAGTAAREITDATMPYMFDQFNKDQAMRMQAAAILPSIYGQTLQTDFSKAGAIGDVGQKIADYDQQAIDEATRNYAWTHGAGEQSALDTYISQINSNPISKASTTTQTTKNSSGIGSTIGSIVSGLGTLNGLGTGIGSIFGSLFGAGTAASGIGAGIGTALGFLSDERMKENIKLVGKENGHNVYEFNYKNGSGKRFRGVLAQEVQKTHPEAVMTGSTGLLSVDYGKIGVKFHEVRAQALDRAAGVPDSRSGGLVEPRAPAGISPECRGL